MERRKFFKTGVQGALAVGLLPISGTIIGQNPEKGEEQLVDFNQPVGKGKIDPRRKKILNADVVVIGAGMSGVCAAVSAARNGAKVILIHDRPVLGGNASSEMRVTVNGTQSLQNKHGVERETGIIEEILLENLYYNPQASYPVWDHVLYNYVFREKNIILLLNTNAMDVIMDVDKIKSVICWQTTTETLFTMNAPLFIDSSGDGLIAATAGASFRQGREGKAEFGEIYAPDKPDGWVMGDCIMMITKDMGRSMPFYPPAYAIPFDYKKAKDSGHREIKQLKEGFWWVELADNVDIIAERDHIRHDLMAYFYGVWDYVKNSGQFPESANLAIDWIGSIPGRRESRRFEGDYMLIESDMTKNRHFEDAVAFGGWSLDEHCPGGIKNLDEPASYFHARFKEVYEVPFRCLYSKNVPNLLFAGRNVSVSHIALSSTRIIGTCSMMGQAVGTAAALCVQKGITPRELWKNNMNLLQEQLLRDDSYFPKRPAQDANDLARKASVIFASSTTSGDVKLLLDGVSRDEVDKVHHWQSDGLNAELQLEWDKPILLSKVEMKFDTNLHRKINMHKNPDKHEEQPMSVPVELVKVLTVEVRVKGQWLEVAAIKDNITRLVKTQFPAVTATAVRLKLQETHGAKNVKMFEIRCYA